MNQLSKSIKKSEVLTKKNKDSENRFYLSYKFLFGAFIFTIIFLFGIFGPIFSSYTYDGINLEYRNLPPSKIFIFGSDELGRDIFTRVCCGARISLAIGLLSTFIDLIIGLFYGAISGYCGKKVDELMMRICDMLSAIPYLLYVIMFAVIFKPGFLTIIIALTLTSWINMARIVRSEILKIKTQEFVLSAIALGASKKRIIFNHLIPNISTTVITTVILSISQAIFTETFLSFLGLGIQAPVASWGTMIFDGISALYYYPWRLFFPAIAITLMILSCNLIGESLKNSFKSL